MIEVLVITTFGLAVGLVAACCAVEVGFKEVYWMFFFNWLFVWFAFASFFRIVTKLDYGAAEETVTVCVTVVGALYVNMDEVWSGTGLVPVKLGPSIL